MTFEQAKEVAIKFGAKLPRWPYAGKGTAGDCWIDRIAYLPVAAERGKLVKAVLEANRYA